MYDQDYLLVTLWEAIFPRQCCSSVTFLIFVFTYPDYLVAANEVKIRQFQYSRAMAVFKKFIFDE